MSKNPQMLQMRRTSFLFRVRTKIMKASQKQHSVRVIVRSALSGRVILRAHCRNISSSSVWAQTVHCLKICIAKDSGISMWEFSLMLDDRLLQDRESFVSPELMMHQHWRQHAPRKCRHLTVQMVRHNIDHRHIIAWNFPSTWIAPSIVQEKVRRLFGKFGRVVAFKDVSDEGLVASGGDCAFAIAVEYSSPANAIRAVTTLDGVDNRSKREKREQGHKPLLDKNRFSCRITCSPASVEPCDCVARNCRASWHITWFPVPRHKVRVPPHMIERPDICCGCPTDRWRWHGVPNNPAICHVCATWANGKIVRGNAYDRGWTNGVR